MTKPRNETTSTEAEPEAEETPKGEVTLALAGPASCTEFNVPDGEGGTMVFDRAGTSVPADQASDLVELAARSGVALRETE